MVSDSTKTTNLTIKRSYSGCSSFTIRERERDTVYFDRLGEELSGS